MLMCLPQLLPDSMACRLYVLAVLVETTVNLAIEGDLYLRIREVYQGEQVTLATRRMPVYLGVFVLAQCVVCHPPQPRSNLTIALLF